MRNILTCFLICLLMADWSVIATATRDSGYTVDGIVYKDRYSTPWVDSVYSSLSLEERIAQLIMIDVQSDRDEAYYNRIARLVMEYNIGGVTFFRGGPKRQVLFTNRLQSIAKTPLFISMDAEWGPAMRLDSLISFPRKMALGAIEDDQLIYQMGIEIGRQLKRLGVHINFAPVIDVNNNPANPVINFRAFGENRYIVAQKGIAYMHGLHDAGIIACAKHFPGHGDTDADSHHTLPLIRQPYEEVDSIHLFPFRQLINKGLKAIMVGHLEMPSLEPESGLASTLSHNIVTNLLQGELGFEGLIITDALQMKGVSDLHKPGELELRALKAGNDILLIPGSVPAAIKTIKEAVNNGSISEELINNKCRKVLYYKEKAGLDNFRYIPLDYLMDDLVTTRAKKLKKHLVEASMTLVRNENNLVPINSLNNKRIATLSIGAITGNGFQQMLANYSNLSFYSIDKYHSKTGASNLIESIAEYDLVIISIHNNSFFPSANYGINGRTVDLVSRIARHQQVVLCVFANPYSLASFGDILLDTEAVLVAYQEGVEYEDAAAQAIFGGIQTKGRLPVHSGRHFDAGTGIITSSPSRIRFGYPEEAGIRSELLCRIDTIAEQGIRKGAFPGCQIAVIKDGVMIYNKSFGHHTYDSLRPVINTDIYDLASITKIAATTVSIMYLIDQGIVDLDSPISSYHAPLLNTDRANITLRQVLAHQGGFFSWIPFYRATIQNGSYIRGIYSNRHRLDFSTKVADNLYINSTYRDTIFSQIYDSDVLANSAYRYSDLGFILLAEMIEDLTDISLERFADSIFYKRIGLSTMGYRPLSRFGRNQIVPTENDTRWRRQIVHGYVHDPAAAMLGGVSGHAGLFSNAKDLAILMHILINNGVYGDEIFFNPNTIKEFTRVQYFFNNNRRGLGFDKPSLNPNEPGPACRSASPFSFGHSGFTGTLAWADPVENIVFVFLSNRTYPNANNRLIIDKNIRTEIQQVVYDAIYYSRFLDKNLTTIIQ